MQSVVNEESLVSVRLLKNLPEVNETEVDALLQTELAQCNRKVVVLDDDPTGVQTVHDIPVYTNWQIDTIKEAFAEKNRMFFILTNSRGMTTTQTNEAHREIALSIDKTSRSTKKDYILISRSDSTLRGHYPLETAVLRKTLEESGAPAFDGEIIYPFFKEGGRYTLNNIHYVKDGDVLIPAGQTEFAKDRSFGYFSSSLPEWCEEKSKGEYPAKDVTCISLEDLRALNFSNITQQMLAVHDFGKVIVNSVDYVDVKVFAIAFLRALKEGRHFLLRGAAAITKVLGGVPDRPLLTHTELVPEENRNGGVVLIGSHVNKTTRQLEELHRCPYPLDFIEFDQHLVIKSGGLEGEVERVVLLAQQKIEEGRSVVIYTRRERFDLPSADADKQLEVSVRISDAVTSIIEKLKVRPNFIVAKGGITSSDVGTKALHVRRAIVMGQIKPGIPVWMTGPESKFPDMPYVIFPGNVGENETLREVVEILMEPHNKEFPACI